MLVAIEGIDGSGKLTQSLYLKGNIEAAGLKAGFLSFPRFGLTAFSEAIARYLNGRFGRLDSISPFLSATLYAGDRYESRELLLDELGSCEVLICDRYVGSNLAYQSARLTGKQKQEFLRWLVDIEYRVFGLPKPDLNILLDVPVSTASALVRKKGARQYTKSVADLHERDRRYLQQCRQAYLGMAAQGIGGAWRVVRCMDRRGRLRTEAEISTAVWEIVKSVLAHADVGRQAISSPRTTHCPAP